MWKVYPKSAIAIMYLFIGVTIIIHNQYNTNFLAMDPKSRMSAKCCYRSLPLCIIDFIWQERNFLPYFYIWCHKLIHFSSTSKKLDLIVIAKSYFYNPSLPVSYLQSSIFLGGIWYCFFLSSEWYFLRYLIRVILLIMIWRSST